MKLQKILDNLNSLEKNAFIKIIDGLISNTPANAKIDSILGASDKGLRSVDNQNICKIFTLIKDKYFSFIKHEFIDTSSQLDILIDIISRDGNNVMKLDWFSRLYEKELSSIKTKVSDMDKIINADKTKGDDQRSRDYKIYHACVQTAYNNDITNNRDPKITDDELSILTTISTQLNLSQEEVKLINYMTIPANRIDTDIIVNNLRNIGVVFFSRKQNTIYVADEVVRILRSIRGREVADKHSRRVLKALKVSEINAIARTHNISPKLNENEKIKEIVKEGVSLTSILSQDIYKNDTTLSDRKKYVNYIWGKLSNTGEALKGITLEEKIANLIVYFENREKDERIGISISGYDKMLTELNEVLPKLNNDIRDCFELQDEFVLSSGFLLDHNIKPRDVLDLIVKEDVKLFCESKGIKTRGDEIVNILDNYRDVHNLYLENYENISFRDMNALKGNGIKIKEPDLGLKFEELTKYIFTELGFNVDEKTKDKLNTKKDKIDILLSLGNNEYIIVECKTSKAKAYHKFSTVSRQLKAYNRLAEKDNLVIRKTLLIAPDFSDDFIEDCEFDSELDLSLLKSSSFISILHSFEKCKTKQFPYKLLMRDVLINEERIIKALNR